MIIIENQLDAVHDKHSNHMFGFWKVVHAFSLVCKANSFWKNTWPFNWTNLIHFTQWFFCQIYFNHQSFVFLFVWRLSRIFHSYGDVTIAGERLQIWPMSALNGNWAMKFFKCATQHPIRWSSRRARDIYTYSRAFSSWLINTCFCD